MSYVVLNKSGGCKLSCKEKDGVPSDKKDGIVTHSWLGKIVRNIASFCTRGYVAGVVDFKVGNKTLHLNFKSLNEWISAIDPNTKIDPKNYSNETIKDTIDKVLSIGSKVLDTQKKIPQKVGNQTNKGAAFNKQDL